MTRGLVISAPASGSGKTIITLALLRALRRRGIAVGSLKIGPDYIDPQFHTLASGGACRNLDLWAMRVATLQAQVASAGGGAQIVVAEGVMGLFDGASDGTGSTADAAVWLGWPVVLVVDVRGQAESAAAVVKGFAEYRPDVRVAGVVFNRAGGPGHIDVLIRSLEPFGIPVLGSVPRTDALAVPDRHLGLVQAVELGGEGRWVENAADIIDAHADVNAIAALAAEGAQSRTPAHDPAIPPLGQNISVAKDLAFSFVYDHLLDGWRAAGARVDFFSPLRNEAPEPSSDAVFLAGGYPELHAETLANSEVFLNGMRKMARAGAAIYGECGGFMVLGEALTDASGTSHTMTGLLPVSTSMAERKLHLGYRRITLLADGPLGRAGARFSGHEFHYSATSQDASTDALFEATDSLGTERRAVGCRAGNTMGSYLHLIDRAPPA